ncbi:calcium/sodium antiporter [Porphyromonas sp. COT-290 OH3588]|uniref:calcium/sodium antiporter n=1 Tax=Porphyromonas sp. COT-290 OH3588 TaxID=1515617 RepID=UPI00052D74C4|nr:calcium/sodium antiporter [Porphyromonas sp. COT-290 OH3588]KGO00224.1 sodium:proton exchanger [Porphyromonas sp. COT-290 OH3588]
MDLLFFVLGIVLIIGGANSLTDGAAALARRMGLSPLMVGLTVVAFGTSAPELVVSLTSALKGSADIAIGNVVGSNIFNILAIVGITALVTPLSITASTVRKEIPLLILASCVFAVIAWDTLFSGLIGQENFLSRSEGLALLGFFLIFLTYTFSIAKSAGEIEQESDPSKKRKPMWLLIALIIGGLAGLIFGGDLFVSSSSSIARSFGVSEAFIGLTLVAMGTSLPELATSVVAALKKEPELAVGNVVGSGLFNIFFILGTTATVTPIKMSGVTVVDFLVMVLSSILLYVFGIFFGQRTITRLEGGILFACFIAYNAYLFSQI